MIRRRIQALALVILAAVSVAAAEATRTLKVEIPVTGPFAVENLAGSFRVVSGSGDTIVATATIHAESDELAAAVRFEPAADGAGRKTYRVRYPYDRVKTFRYPGGASTAHEGAMGWLASWIHASNTNTTYDGRSVAVASASGTLLYADVEVVVPSREVDANFRNVVGNLQARGVEGKVKFDTGSGDLALDSIEGEAVADTGSGDIHASKIRGSFKADTGSGNIGVEGFDGDSFVCDVGSGDIQLKDVRTKKFKADTGSGDIEASGLIAETIDVDTGSGDVLLRADGTALSKIRADTGSGDVTLQLGPEASFEAIASQGSGDIVNRFGDAQPIVKGKEVIGYRRGGGQTKITVETGSGDLVIEPGS